MSATTKLFVGLTFYTDNSFSKNVESFRSRFDTKYENTPYLHLALVSAFEVENPDVEKLKEELVEEVESFFFENTENHRLEFSGLDVQEHKKNKILYLKPAFEEELALCQESLYAICKSYLSDREKVPKTSKKTFLTIGRFNEPMDLHASIELAQKEFQEITSLAYESICLFSKNNGVWYREADLITFDKPTNTFLQNSSVPL